ncbi:MAG: tRNA (adenine(22)-N(1))-methyltransferase TrmK [Eubacteriales bacterium]|nr:tRNA (adenine(22)-N(1))-methyltransferase TrmK [Eubacteriales bacterium]
MSINNRKRCDPNITSIKRGQRLQALAAFVPAGSERLIDVGCDHAIVPLELLSQGRVKEVLLIDINDEPLNRAKARAKTQFPQLRDKICYLKQDGYYGVEGSPGDILLISGLGGETIAEILINAFEDKREIRPSRLILQPQTKQFELRSALKGLSFAVSEEHLVLDDDRYYTIIICDTDDAEASPLNELQLYIGPRLLYAVEERLRRGQGSEEDALLLDWARLQAERLILEGRGDAARARLAQKWLQLLERGNHDEKY